MNKIEILKEVLKDRSISNWDEAIEKAISLTEKEFQKKLYNLKEIYTDKGMCVLSKYIKEVFKEIISENGDNNPKGQTAVAKNDNYQSDTGCEEKVISSAPEDISNSPIGGRDILKEPHSTGNKKEFPSNSIKKDVSEKKGCGKKVYMHFGVPIKCGEFNLGELVLCDNCKKGRKE
jgi:hypothetical protein